jgi:polyisoprenoid-binding protein YceI
MTLESLTGRTGRHALLTGLFAMAAIVAAACGSDAAGPTATESATATSQSIDSSPTATASSGETATPSPSSGGDLLFEVGDGSIATFTVREKLTSLPAPNDAVLKADAITGTVNLDGDSFIVTIDLHDLESDQDRRDSYVRRNLFPAQRNATVTFPGIASLPDGLLSGDEVTATATGTVNVNGSDAEVEFEIEARLDGDVLYVLGRGDFTWADFGMTAPVSQLFVVEDEVHVEVLLATEKVS